MSHFARRVVVRTRPIMAAAGLDRPSGRIGPRLKLLEPDLAVGLLLPDVPDVVDRRAVAFPVERNVADHGVEGHARMHDFGDRLRVERIGFLGRLLDDLDAGVGVERVPLRIEALRLERRHRFLRIRVVARLGSEGHQRALDPGAADLGELRIGDAVAGDHHCAHPLVAHLAQDQAALGVQAAPHQIVGARLLDLGDDRRIVFFSGVDAFVEDLVDAELVHVVARRVREALAVGRLVVDDGDLFALQFVSRELGPDEALLVVAPAGPEGVPEAAIGHFRVGRRRRDEQDAVFRIDVGGGNGHARIEMADDELDAVADELVGDRNALFGIRNVVPRLDLELLAENAATLVDILDGLLDSLGQLGAERCVGAGDRPRDADLDLRPSGACQRER